MMKAQHKQAPKERVIPLPKLLDEFTVFDPLERLMIALEHNTLSADDNNKFTMTFINGTPSQVAEVLAGWNFTWEKIIRDLSLTCDISALKTIVTKLHALETDETSTQYLTIDDISLARSALSRLKIIFRSTARDKLQSIAKTAQIAIFLQDSL